MFSALCLGFGVAKVTKLANFQLAEAFGLG
jgi:hypothetical protein